MKQYVEMEAHLTSESRNLLSVAYKNVVGAHRSAWRVVSSIESRQSDDQKREGISSYRKEIEKDLNFVCTEVLVSLILKLKYLQPYSQCTYCSNIP